ncbi:hypothetical protein ACR92I_27100, partial [Klebsiella pneumoniae]
FIFSTVNFMMSGEMALTGMVPATSTLTIVRSDTAGKAGFNPDLIQTTALLSSVTTSPNTAVPIQLMPDTQGLILFILVSL